MQLKNDRYVTNNQPVGSNSSMQYSFHDSAINLRPHNPKTIAECKSVQTSISVTGLVMTEVLVTFLMPATR
jgi:hypothetical protein